MCAFDTGATKVAMITVLIADDQAVVRDVFRFLLEVVTARTANKSEPRHDEPSRRDESVTPRELGQWSLG